MGKLFLDMDGVLTDFDGQFERWFGKKVKVWLYKTDATIRATIDEHLATAPEEFWADMPWLPGAKEFWHEMVPRAPIVLSSPHFAPSCIQGKWRWAQQNLGPKVPLILDTAKGAHGRPDDLLVDDTPTNSQGWKGLFVLHRDWADTRRQIGFFPYLCEYQI
jgi:hypothetical protein